MSRLVRSSWTVRRSRAERLLAWLYTGPLGHLYGVLADLAAMWVRYTRSRVRDRLRG